MLSDTSGEEATIFASANIFLRLSKKLPAKLVGVAFVGACLLATHCTIQSGKLGPTSQSLDTYQDPLGRTRIDLLHLLRSAEIRQAIEDASIRLAGIAQHLAEAGPETSAHLSLTFNTRRLELPSQVQTRLRQESALGLDASLQQFFATHPEAYNELQMVNITDEQSAAVLHMLQSFTDERLFDLSMHFLHLLYSSASQSGSTLHIIHKHIKLHSAELQGLRDELIPICMRKLSSDVKKQHIELLSKKGAFRMRGRIGDWKADLEFAQMRRMQLSSPKISTSMLSSDPPSRKLSAQASVNWFTIGAPTVSNMLGLVFLSLMALLPARGGLPSNRAANYAMWGLQGASTLGECFSNFGILTQGIVYFAPCMIDILFFGMDVAWVFFDGLPHNFPQHGVRCASYSQWPRIDRRVCGDCLALVPTQPWDGRCKGFCESFGHECVFAAEEIDESCIGQSRYGCDESINHTSDMLCQCRQSEATNRSLCAPYSHWPSIFSVVCGGCAAHVDARRFNNVCNDYCASFGHECASAFPGRVDQRCTIEEFNDVGCSAQARSVLDDRNVICECRSGSGPVSARPICAEYTQWPQINGFVCGDCEAIVPVNVPYQGKVFRSCSEFCTSFGHECSRAATGETICGVVGDEDILPCDGPILDLRTQRCQCVLPGVIITSTTTSTTTSSTTTPPFEP